MNPWRRDPARSARGCGCARPATGAGGGPGGGVNVQTVLLCDVLPDGTTAGFALLELVYDTGSGQRVASRTVDPVMGTPYAPAGLLQPCQPDSCNSTVDAQLLCDTTADGEVTQFLRVTTYCAGVEVGAVDRTLDGAPYTPTGTTGPCHPDAGDSSPGDRPWTTRGSDPTRLPAGRRGSAGAPASASPGPGRPRRAQAARTYGGF